MGVVKYTGPVASFHCPTNAEIRSLKVHFSPKQEGSGDPSPENVREIVGWDGVSVLQSGKNLLDTSKIYQHSVTQVMLGQKSSRNHWETFLKAGTYTISTSTSINANVLISRKSIGSSSTSLGNTNKFLTVVLDIDDWCEFFVYKSSGITITDIISFQLEVNQTATSYEPYQGSTTNYEFGVLGKNKWDEEWEIGGIDTTTGLPINATNRIRSKNYISIVPNTTYYWLTSGSQCVGFMYDKNYNLLTWPNETNKYKIISNNTFTTSEECRYFKFYCSASYGTTYNNDIALNYPSTYTTYEPYDPNHTVYGGWVDLITGEVCEEMTCVIIDGTQTIQAREQYENSNLFRVSRTQFEFIPRGYHRDEMCSYLKPVVNVTQSGNYSPWMFYINVTTRAFHFSFPTSYDLTAVQSYIQENPLQLCYYIDPITYHLAPTQLQTFLGQNNIWSNADYVEVEYDLHETQDILARKQFIIANQPHIVKPAAAPLQNFVTDVPAPLKECKVHFSPVQEGEGDPSPENVREIKGWNGIIASANRAPLPEEYQEVEYIQSTSIYSYFITDYYPSDKTDYYIKIHQGNAGTNEFYPTAFSAGPQFELYKIGYYVWYNYKGTSYADTAAYGTNRQLIEMFTKGNNWTVVAPGVRTSTYSIPSYSSFISEKPLIILAREVNGEIRDNRIGDPYPKLYRFTLYENEQTVRDYVPCYRKSDNEVGLYDLVNKTFLTHSGEGTFDAGPDITTGSIVYTNWTTEAGTVYGGYVDLVKGELVQTYYKLTFDGTETTMQVINKSSSSITPLTYVSFASSSNNKIARALNGSEQNQIITSFYSHGQYALNTSDHTYHGFAADTVNHTQTIVGLFLPCETSDITNYLSTQYNNNTPVEICYPLLSPITYQIDPATLKTLRGTNNIWSTANGNVEIAYWTH